MKLSKLGIDQPLMYSDKRMLENRGFETACNRDPVLFFCSHKEHKEVKKESFTQLFVFFVLVVAVENNGLSSRVFQKNI